MAKRPCSTLRWYVEQMDPSPYFPHQVADAQQIRAELRALLRLYSASDVPQTGRADRVEKARASVARVSKKARR